MMYAIDVMSRNKDGVFPWTSQIVATLNALGDMSVDNNSSVEYILKSISRLDNDSKRTLFSMKVSFNDEFNKAVKEEEEEMKKDSQVFFYGFTVFVVLIAGYLVYSGGHGDIEPETMQMFMDFLTNVLKLASNQGNVTPDQ